MSITLYQVLSLLAVPSLFALIYGRMFARIEKKQQQHDKELEKNNNETKAVMLGVQALLRAEMIKDYNKWSDRGYAPIYARESFENCWEQYHSLGANGVMDDIHDKFMELPTTKP